MYDASSEARNSTASATSSTRPSRFIGTALSDFSRQAGSADALEVRIGGMTPGCTELTRMPCCAYCTAADLVMIRTAPFDALYPMWIRSWPTKPEIDEMLTMAPPPASRIAGTACFMPRKTPFAFTFMRVSQAAVLVVSGSNVPLIPALFTRSSSFPKAVTVALTAACQSASLVTSSFTNRAWPPAAAIFSTTWRASNSSTSATMTRAPSRAKITASLWPIPLAPPVMSATFPTSLICPSSFMSRPCPTPLVARRGEYRREPPTVYTAGRCFAVPGRGPISYIRSDHGDVCARSRRVSGGLDLEAGRGSPAGLRTPRLRADARRLCRAPPSGTSRHHRRHARSGNRAAPVLRGSHAGGPRGDELRRHGDLQGRRAGPRPHRPARLRRRAGVDVWREGRRYRETRGRQRDHRDHDRTRAGRRGETAVRGPRFRHARLGPGALHAASGGCARGARGARELLEPGVARDRHPLSPRHESTRDAPAPHGRAAESRLARARHRPLSDAQPAGRADAATPGAAFLTGALPRCTVPSGAPMR